MKKFLASSTAVLAAMSGAFAAPVAEGDALVAAGNFVGSDPVGAAVFGGRTVSGARDADGLWIVSLAPAGHVVFSGSDLVEPVVCFSPTDYSEPDSESPARAMFDDAREASLEAEESGAYERHPKWTKLLERRNRATLRAGPVDSPTVIVVPPFMQSHYNQWQPYNDYCPVYDSSTNTTAYRGRCPCGCVATAVAQSFRHFRWPARIDRSYRYDHSFIGTNGIETTFPIRFDGHAPIDWDALNDAYSHYAVEYITNFYPSGGYEWRTESRYDLRRYVAESTRHPIARLVLLADAVAQMYFEANGSGASYDNAVPNIADWYTRGEWVDLQGAAERVRADICAGIPCHISLGEYDQAGVRVNGHQIIAHGWAEDGTTQYAYMNFGWGGNNDGYYNIADDLQTYQEKRAYVGHYPRAKPQLEPLPKVCGRNVTLNWHFPDIYNSSLSGFTVAVSKTSTTPTTFLDDFSDSKGVSSSGDGIYITTDSAGYDGNLLFAKPTAVGTYTHPGSYTLTSASVLTFRLYSFAALGAVYQIEGRFNGGEWTPLCTPALKTDWGGSGWSTERVYLGSHGGQTVQFRISNSHSGPYYPQDESRILIDDFQVTEILEEEASTTYEVSAIERNFVLPPLDAGVAYSFTVTPGISGALVDGETSDSVSATVAGLHRTPVPGEQTYHTDDLSFSASDANVQTPVVPAVEWDTVAMSDLGTPAILSVSNVVDGVAVFPVREGFFRECKYGETNEFDVVCSGYVENLNAYSSHLALVGERQVTTRRVGPHTFRVSVDASNIDGTRSRSRMILTLEATDANGTKAYKDLSLRFSAEGEVPVVDPLGIATSVLPPATSGVPYSVAMEAIGGNGDYAWIASDAFGYDSQTQSDGSFNSIGTARGWKADDGCWELALPFDFPFYGSTYRAVYVSSNGTLTFDDGDFTNWTPSDGTLSVTKMIAAMWKDLDTSSGDIYAECSAEAVTIRWSGTYRGDSASVSFSATLHPDGRVRLSYGSGNAYGGWIGVSSGNGAPFYTLSDECSAESSPVSMDNANDIVFTPNAPVPDWLHLSHDGVLSGTPAASGSATFRIYVMGHVGDAVKEIYKTFHLTVEAAPATETSQTPVPVPYSWLDGYVASFPSPVAGAVPDYEAMAQMPTGKRNADGSPTRLWQEYLTGTNPTNASDVFRASIEMVGRRPVVRWTPDLNSNGLCNARSYTVLGRTNLADAAEWAPTNSGHRFFRVIVEPVK